MTLGKDLIGKNKKKRWSIYIIESSLSEGKHDFSFYWNNIHFHFSQFYKQVAISRPFELKITIWNLLSNESNKYLSDLANI